MGGVALRFTLDCGTSAGVFLALLAAALYTSRIFIPPAGAGKKFFTVGALMLCALSAGDARADFWEARNIPALGHYAGTFVEAEGFVLGTPEIGESYQRLTLRLESINGEHFVGRRSEDILVYTSHFPEFRYGDRLSIRGALERIPRGMNEDGLFDWSEYLRWRGIHYEFLFPRITEENGFGGNPFKRFLIHLRERFASRIQENLAEPHASFLSGLLFGARGALGEKVEDDFRDSGLIHILVLSGYNVTIVAESMMRSLGFLPPLLRSGVGVFGIILFLMLAGAGASGTRAAIMAVLVILARATGRVYEVTASLALTAFVMVFIHPYLLLSDRSFELSVLATIGLIHVAPFFERVFRRLPEALGLRFIASATLGTQLLVLPLLLYTTGALSLVSLPANLLVLPLIPLTMLIGFIVGLAGFIGGFAAAPFSWAAYVLLEYELGVAEFFSSFPFASLSLGRVPGWAVLALYTALFLIIFSIVRMRKPKL